MSNIAKVTLKRDIKRRVLLGHPWIYDNEIERIDGDYINGSIVDVYTFAGQFLGRGYINTNSKITVRILTRKPVDINREFIKNRFDEALRNRFNTVCENAYRVVFSEVDGLPGLIVDKFDKYLSVQFNTLGINMLKHQIIDVLIEIFNPAGIFEHTEGSVLEKEGLEEKVEWIYGTGPELIPFEVDGIKFLADTKGQNTGAFLDQRENVRKLMEFAKDKICLDCFSYTGNFSMHLLRSGAKHVTFVDYSERAIEIAKEIANLNLFKDCDFVVVNAFDYLKSNYENSKLFDLIVLDPPSFAKSSSNRDAAFKGYKEINYRSMRILKSNGILATASCTQVISQNEFENTLVEAGIDAKVLLKLLYRGGQSIDYPQMYNILESMYLKFLIIQIVYVNTI